LAGDARLALAGRADDAADTVLERTLLPSEVDGAVAELARALFRMGALALRAFAVSGEGRKGRWFRGETDPALSVSAIVVNLASSRSASVIPLPMSGCIRSLISSAITLYACLRLILRGAPSSGGSGQNVADRARALAGREPARARSRGAAQVRSGQGLLEPLRD